MNILSLLYIIYKVLDMRNIDYLKDSNLQDSVAYSGHHEGIWIRDNLYIDLEMYIIYNMLYRVSSFY